MVYTNCFVCWISLSLHTLFCVDDLLVCTFKIVELVYTLSGILLCYESVRYILIYFVLLYFEQVDIGIHTVCCFCVDVDVSEHYLSGYKVSCGVVLCHPGVDDGIRLPGSQPP